MVVEITDVLSIETMFGSLAFLLSISACTAGVAWRTFSKWKDKIDAGENVPFDAKFVYQAVGVLIASVAVAFPLTQLGIEQINQYAGTIGLIGAWILTAAWAYALNDGTNGVIKRIETKSVVTAIKSGRFDDVIDRKVEERLQQRLNNSQLQPQPQSSEDKL